MNKTHIGEKVWAFNKVGNWSYILNTEKTYTITEEIREDDGYITAYKIKADDGEERTMDYNEVVFCPKEGVFSTNDEMLYNYLKDNGVYSEVYTNSEGVVMVSISWGDWKHEHGWCDDLMSYIKYGLDDEIETKENGSDCYSSEHYYSKRG